MQMEKDDWPIVIGFEASGVGCDIRGTGVDRLDLAVLYSGKPCSVAGVFTRNKMAAAPVRLGREQLSPEGTYHGVVVNSGNANACTGEQGMADALKMREWVAKHLGCGPKAIFVCSTGRIGRPLPMDRIESGISHAVSELGITSVAYLRAADAILTSDTRRKVAFRKLEIGHRVVTLSGMAKGAGMIEPDMATMLAFITTDAGVSGDHLQTLLQDAVKSSFNAITVDGDSSTNDTVLVLANGASGVELNPNASAWAEFRSALVGICAELARMIVADGEKITKVVELIVEGAASELEAEKAARAVGNSLLVKASWYGEDPNWGRLVDALGYSGAEMSEDTVTIQYGLKSGPWVSVFEEGEVVQVNQAQWKEIVSEKEFRIRFDLGQGMGAFSLLSTDLTEGYVNFNRSE